MTSLLETQAFAFSTVAQENLQNLYPAAISFCLRASSGVKFSCIPKNFGLKEARQLSDAEAMEGLSIPPALVKASDD